MAVTLSQSLSRTVVWTPALLIPVPADGSQTKLPLRWAERSAASRLDYTIDLSWWLKDQGDTLLSATWAIFPANGTTDMTVVDSALTDHLYSILVSGGTVNTDYQASLAITTSGGRQETFIVSILTNDDTPSQAPQTQLSIGLTSDNILPVLTAAVSALPTADPGEPGLFINGPGGPIQPSASLATGGSSGSTTVGLTAYNLVGVLATTVEGLPTADPHAQGDLFVNGPGGPIQPSQG